MQEECEHLEEATIKETSDILKIGDSFTPNQAFHGSSLQVEDGYPMTLETASLKVRSGVKPSCPVLAPGTLLASRLRS